MAELFVSTFGAMLICAPLNPSATEYVMSDFACVSSLHYYLFPVSDFSEYYVTIFVAFSR